MQQRGNLFDPFTLPCGLTLKNRIAKSAMSDSLGDGIGHPTKEQNRLYQRWANGGLAVSIIGEVQGTGLALIKWRDFHSVSAIAASNLVSDLQAKAECRRMGL